MKYIQKLSFLLLLLIVVNCGNEKKIYKQFDTVEFSTNQNNDDDVSAWNGGPGFEIYAEQLGWETNNNVQSVGSPDAIKGDTITLVGEEVMPPTFRAIGKETRLQFLSIIEALTYEPLLSFNYETSKYEPELATHWKIGQDSITYFFRIDPRAKWSDGRDVTSQDVVSTYKLRIDKGHGDPNTYTSWEEDMYEPIAETKYIVSVKFKKKSWGNFKSIAQAMVYPSYYLDKIDGSTYLEKYQYELMPGSGPYIINMNLTTQENNGLVVFDRRTDYWAIDEPRNIGINNFDVINFIFIDDDNQLIERFFNNDYDIYAVSRAQWWNGRFTADEYPQIKRGLIQRLKVFNFRPTGVSGLSFNTKEWPFDDIEVRKAFSHIWDLEKLMDKLFFNEYVGTNSYWPWSKYEHPENPIQDYNPDKALKILNQAGWAKQPGDKWLSKDGKNFEIDMYTYSGWDRIHNFLVNDLEAIGIKLNLLVIQNPFDKYIQKTFTIHYGGWTGYPEAAPKGMLHSQYADQIDVTNTTSMANITIDSLIDNYEINWNFDERVRLIQQIDSIATREYHYIFGWAAPYGWRGLYQNRFGKPEKGLSYGSNRYNRHWGGWANHILLWWSDPKKKELLRQARQSETMSLPIEDEIIDYWKKLD
tara:strand:+ start:559 stop:2484 length:1926 start_codon:yes stop_codon:yes gene_type:complete